MDKLSEITRKASNVWRDGFKRGITPEPTLTVSEWADQHRILPDTSAEPGRWRTARTPYIKEIMDNLSVYSPVERTVLMKGTQIAGTEGGNNWAFYTMDVAPCPMLVVLPTDTAAKDHAKDKINPTIIAMPRLSQKLKRVRSRASGSTMTKKEFLGGFITIGGANTGVTFRHKSIRNLHASDVDGWPLDVDGEGDPLGLSVNRTDAFGRRKKLYIESTPTAEVKSRIAKEYQDTDQRHYHVPCPHCEKKQVLEWGGPDAPYGFKWERGADGKGKPETVMYMCKHCGKLIAERHKPWMLELGEWLPSNPGHRHRGYHLPSFYSPLGWLSWVQIVEEFLKAKRDNDALAMKRWVTTRKAEPYRDTSLELNHKIIYARREDYGIVLPLEAQVVVAAVDTQDNRLEVKTAAYGKGRQKWALEHIVIPGSPAEQRVWDELDKIITDKSYLHESGAWKKISLTCIDSGGHHTKRVYDFVRPREVNRVYATKGSSTAGAPLVSRPSMNNLGKIKLYFIGTHTAKELIYSSLKIETHGPGFMHYNKLHDEEFFRQLTVETFSETTGKWDAHNSLNEALDLEVMELAALEILNPDWESFDALDLTRRTFFPYMPEVHDDEDMQLRPDLPIMVCCEFTRDPMIWLYCQTDGKHVWAIDELKIRNSNTVRMGAETIRRYGNHKAGLVVYGSAAGADRTGGGRSDYAILSDLGLTVQRVKRLNPPLFDRVNAVNNMLEDIPGAARLKVGPKCINLRRDFERAVWRDDGTEIDNIEHGRGQAAVALSYFIDYQWPLRSTKPNLKKRFYK